MSAPSYLIFIFVLLFSSQGVFAGYGSRIVECTTGPTTTRQLVDLWEAHYHYGYDIPTQHGTVEQILDQQIERLVALDPKYFAGLKDEIEYLRSTYTLLPKELRIPLIVERNPVIVPAHCQLKQLGKYKAFHMLELDGLYYRSMGQLETSQAATFIHEALNKIHAELEYVYLPTIRTSAKIRRIVGLIFSDLSDQEIQVTFEREFGQWEPNLPSRCELWEEGKRTQVISTWDKIYNTENGLVKLMSGLMYDDVKEVQAWELSKGKNHTLPNAFLKSNIIYQPTNYTSHYARPYGGLPIGRVDWHGRIYNQSEKRVGSITKNSKVLDMNGLTVASIRACDITNRQNVQSAAAMAYYRLFYRARLKQVSASSSWVAAVGSSVNAFIMCRQNLMKAGRSACNDGLFARIHSDYKVNAHYSKNGKQYYVNCSAKFACGYATKQEVQDPIEKVTPTSNNS